MRVRLMLTGGRYWLAALAFVCVLLTAHPAAAAERLCDSSSEDCRAPLLALIRAETVGIDVGMHHMTDTQFSEALIERHRAGVPVRIILDVSAVGNYIGYSDIINQLVAAGIPIRRRRPGTGSIMHWKAMIFAGQNTVEFSAANFSSDAFVPDVPYASYTDEVAYFCDDQPIVNSFKTKFEDYWTDNVDLMDYANVTWPTARRYPVHTKDPSLNFPAAEPYYDRIVALLNAETQGIDVTMYRIGDNRFGDAVVAARQRGVRVRLLVEPIEYRNPESLRTSYNIDRMYVAGAQIKHRQHMGLTHQKTVTLHGQATTIHGSSNWGGNSEEHNYFTTKAWFFQYFVDLFERKWNNSNPHGVTEYAPSPPLPPDAPVLQSPADGAQGQVIPATLQWEGGPWAHKFDVRIGTSPNSLQPFAANAIYPKATKSHFPADAPVLSGGAPDCTVQRDGTCLPDAPETIVLTGLQPATKYYWRVVGKTMSGRTAESPVRSFTTAQTVTPITLSSLTLSTTTVAGCKKLNATVALNQPAPAGGAAVLISVTNPAASAPASVTILAGQVSKTFAVTTTPVAVTQQGSVTASYAGVSKAAALTVRPIGLQSITLSPNPVIGPGSVSGTANLECAAAPGDILVTISSTKPSVAAPTVSSILIPAGTKSRAFMVATSRVTTSSAATITAKANGTIKSKKLTVTP